MATLALHNKSESTWQKLCLLWFVPSQIWISATGSRTRNKESPVFLHPGYLINIIQHTYKVFWPSDSYNFRYRTLVGFISCWAHLLTAIIQACSSHKLNCKVYMHVSCLCSMPASNSIAYICDSTEVEAKQLMEVIKGCGWYPILGQNKSEQTKILHALIAVYYARHCNAVIATKFVAFQSGQAWYKEI